MEHAALRHPREQVSAAPEPALDPRALLESGRGRYLIARALHCAIRQAGESERSPAGEREEMQRLLAECFAEEAETFEKGEAAPVSAPAPVTPVTEPDFAAAPRVLVDGGAAGGGVKVTVFTYSHAVGGVRASRGELWKLAETAAAEGGPRGRYLRCDLRDGDTDGGGPSISLLGGVWPCWLLVAKGHDVPTSIPSDPALFDAWWARYALDGAVEVLADYRAAAVADGWVPPRQQQRRSASTADSTPVKVSRKGTGGARIAPPVSARARAAAEAASSVPAI